MGMVEHQTICPAGRRGEPAALGEQIDVGSVVGLPEKDLLAAVAALGDMMGVSCKGNTSNARHAGCSSVNSLSSRVILKRAQ
jgi:hypothetical protein